jgi:hypothetical protein
MQVDIISCYRLAIHRKLFEYKQGWHLQVQMPAVQT